MSQFEIKYPSGATSLDPNEIAGLIPDYITTQGELNSLELENILEAAAWAIGKKHPDVLSATFAYNLHKRMFGRVWRWAGKPRQSDKNIGVLWEQIPEKLASLIGDTKYWIENKTFPWDEIGTRFHFRLVAVHAFPNGNGRHARFMTDILLESNEQNPFTWGSKTSEVSMDVEGPVRNEYIVALKEADNNKFDRLIRFVRS